VACLARCNGAVARVVRPPPFDEREKKKGEEESAAGTGNLDLDLDDESEKNETEATRAALAGAEAQFRSAVLEACRGGPESIVASYSRALVSQTGEGHFSPIGAFDETSDSVLVLDVARFKYSPHWLPLRSLVRAMRAPDKATGLPRGWLGVRAAPALRSVLFTLEGGGGGGGGEGAAARFFGETTLPELLASSSSSSSSSSSKNDLDASSLVSKAAAAAPLAAVAAFVGLRAPSAAAAAETAAAAAAAAAALASSSLNEGGGAAAAAAAAKAQAPPHACGSETEAEEATTACAIPDAAAALLAELEAWPALRVVREALDRAHPGKKNNASAVVAAAASESNAASGGCSARSSAAASVAGRADVAHAAAVAAREKQELEIYGLLPERLALFLAAAAPSDESSPTLTSPSSTSLSPWPAGARKLLTPPSGSVLAAEVSYLRAQWKELPALDAASAASAKAAGKGGCGCGV